jgi:hypothetical protein
VLRAPEGLFHRPGTLERCQQKTESSLSQQHTVGVETVEQKSSSWERLTKKSLRWETESLRLKEGDIARGQSRVSQVAER